MGKKSDQHTEPADGAQAQQPDQSGSGAHREGAGEAGANDAGASEGQASGSGAAHPPPEADADQEETPTPGAAQDGKDLEYYRDLALRNQAELENFRRRSEKELEKARLYALERFSLELLALADSLEKSVQEASVQEPQSPLGDGIELCERLLRDTLKKFGVQSMDPLGHAFDPQLHEATGVLPSAEVPPNSVVEVLRKGYLLNGRLLRAAMVVVAQPPAAGASADAADSDPGASGH